MSELNALMMRSRGALTADDVPALRASIVAETAADVARAAEAAQVAGQAAVTASAANAGAAEALSAAQAARDVVVAAEASVQGVAEAAEAARVEALSAAARAESAAAPATELVADVSAMQPVVSRVGEALQEQAVEGLLVTITDADGNRTWLEANSTNGGPTDRAEKMLAGVLGVGQSAIPGYAAALVLPDGTGAERLTDLAIRSTDGQFADFVVARLAARIAPYLQVSGSSGVPQSELYSLAGRPTSVLPRMDSWSGWGSSSVGQPASGDAFSGIAAEVGATYYNGGKGREVSQQTTARLGSRPALITFPAGLIPASGAVEVTSSNLPVSDALLTYQGVIGGVEGRLSSTNAALTFTRISAGAEVSVQPNAAFVPTVGAARRGDLLILWIGKNNLDGTDSGAVSQVIEDTAATWNYGDALFKRRVVMGHFVDGNTPADSPIRAQIQAVNADYAARYGNQYFDTTAYITSPLIFEDMGITPTSSDLAQQALGNKPPSVSADSGHFSAAGYAAVAYRVKQKMIALGWFPAATSEEQ